MPNIQWKIIGTIICIFVMFSYEVIAAPVNVENFSAPIVDQIVVKAEEIDLIPGVTTEMEINKVHKDKIFFTFGGLALMCPSIEYSKKILYALTCEMGKKSMSMDTAKPDDGTLNLITNIEAYNILVKGFTKKFGKPQMQSVEKLQNAFGGTFDQNQVAWIDKKGNSLLLVSITENIDVGGFMLISNQKMADDASKNNKRQF